MLRLSVARAALALRPQIRVSAVRTARIAPIARPTFAKRFYSPQSLDPDAKIVKFEDVQENLGKPNVVFVDVREPDEYAAGHIPNALNIPFRSSPGALGLDDVEFQETFGFDKPAKDSKIVFYCQGGVRSSGAEQLAATYGYHTRENYKGSFADWTEHNGEVSTPK